MDLGAFSVSLAVKDLAASRAFYKALGFDDFGGMPAENWAIMANGDHVIGLFQGMFEDNILTFNPGWNQKAQNTETYTDVLELQKRLKAAGVELATEADETTSGPAHLILKDPDGNTIMIDQHR